MSNLISEEVCVATSLRMVLDSCQALDPQNLLELVPQRSKVNCSQYLAAVGGTVGLTN